MRSLPSELLQLNLNPAVRLAEIPVHLRDKFGHLLAIDFSLDHNLPGVGPWRDYQVSGLQESSSYVHGLPFPSEPLL